MARIRFTSANAKAAIACIAFSVASIPFALNSSPAWAWVACGLLMAAALGLELRPDDYVDEIEISDTSITRRFGYQGHEQQSESVAWGDLQRIVIRTADSGMTCSDFYYMLFGTGANGVIVTEDVARRQNLLVELERRFPSFDHRTFIEAAGCRFPMAFTVWERGREMPQPA